MHRAEPHFSDTALRHCRSLSAVAAGAVGAVAIAVLVGWMLRREALVGVVPGSVGIKVNTAVALLLAAVALALLRQPHSGVLSAARLRTSRLLAAVGGGIGATTLLEYMTGFDFGVDEVLVRDFAAAIVTSSPGRMSPITAASFLLLALAMLAVDRPWRGATRLSQTLSLLTPILPALALLGYLYDVPPLYGLFRGSQIAPPTAACFVLLGLGVAALRPTEGWMRTMTLDGLAGRMARALLPLSLLAPVAIGWLRLQGQRAGLYGTEFGIALQVLATALLLSIVAVAIGSVLGRQERQRLLAEAAVADREQQLRLAVESADLGVWSWDIATGALEWSDRCRALFGVGPAEPMTYERFLAALHPQDRERNEAIVAQALAAHAPYNLEYRSLWPDGSIHWIAARGLGYYDRTGTPVRMRGVALDIDERKRSDSEREALVLALEQRSRELEQVVYVTSHDLRSPLVNIQGFSEELARSIAEIETLLPERGDAPAVGPTLRSILHQDIPEALGYIRKSAARMDDLLCGLLELSRAGRTHPSMLPVDMNQLIAEAIAGLEYEIERHGVAVEIAELPPCLGDANQLAQVFANLLGNAVKFLDPARPGRLEVDAETSDGTSRVVYHVRDNGVGIDPNHQGKIFEIFHRLDPAGSPGDGLGLSIVQKLVALHGGRVWVDSAPGSGSTFHVELTAAATPEVHP